MKRALAPWLLPVALLVGLLVAVTNSLIVYGVVLMLLGWVVIPFALAYMRRSGRWPRSVQGDPEKRRFLGF